MEVCCSFRFPLRSCFAPIRGVKFAVSLLALLAFSLAACNTLATRRDLYAPAKPNDPYTKYLKRGGQLPRPKVKTAPAATQPAPGAEEALPDLSTTAAQ